MRFILLTIALFTSLGLNAQLNSSLKIEMEDRNTIIYPPNSKFEVRNQSGDLLYDQNDLKEGSVINIRKGEEITVFTKWADGKDVFNPKSANISLSENEKVETKDIPFWEVGRPDIVSEMYSKSGSGEYNAEIEFEGNIKFIYENGNAEITENGKDLELLGKYIANTSQGMLKLSYEAEKKKLYYVFTDDSADSLITDK
jgi:hypothetical protein